MGMTLKNLTPSCASHTGVKLCGVHPTTESSDQNGLKKLRGVHHTLESSSVVCIPLQSPVIKMV